MVGLWCPFCRRHIARSGRDRGQAQGGGRGDRLVVATAPENAKLYFKFRPTKPAARRRSGAHHSPRLRRAAACRDPGVHADARGHQGESHRRAAGAAPIPRRPRRSRRWTATWTTRSTRRTWSGSGRSSRPSSSSTGAASSGGRTSSAPRGMAELRPDALRRGDPGRGARAAAALRLAPARDGRARARRRGLSGVAPRLPDESSGRLEQTQNGVYHTQDGNEPNSPQDLARRGESRPSGNSGLASALFVQGPAARARRALREPRPQLLRQRA